MSEETNRYWITKSAYIQQAGEDLPHYVEASPDAPALITLPEGVKPAKNMKPESKPPAALKSGFMKKKKAPDYRVKGPAKGKRAADQ